MEDDDDGMDGWGLDEDLSLDDDDSAPTVYPSIAINAPRHSLDPTPEFPSAEPPSPPPKCRPPISPSKRMRI